MITLEKKIVSINNETAPILEIYDNYCSTHEKQLQTSQEMQTQDAVEVKGLYGHFLKLGEAVTGGQHGAKTRTFPKIHRDIPQITINILNNFIELMNEKLKFRGSIVIEANIQKGWVLVREIVLRTITAAFNNGDKNSVPLIQLFMQDFINDLLEQNVFEQYEEAKLFFHSPLYNKWYNFLLSTTEFLQKLKAPEKIIGSWANEIREIDLDTKRILYLVLLQNRRFSSFFTNSKKLDADLHEGQIHNCLREAIESVKPQNTSEGESALAITQERHSLMSSTLFNSANFIKEIEEHLLPHIEQGKDFFSNMCKFSKKNADMLELLTKLHSIAMITGWVLFISEALNTNELRKNLALHIETMDQLRSVELQAVSADFTSVYRVKINTMSKIKRRSLDDLSSAWLDNKIIHSEIFGFLIHNLMELKNYQDKLGFAVIEPKFLYRITEIITPSVTEPIPQSVIPALNALPAPAAKAGSSVASSSTSFSASATTSADSAQAKFETTIYNTQKALADDLRKKEEFRLPDQNSMTYFDTTEWVSSIFSVLPYQETQILEDFSNERISSQIANCLFQYLLEVRNDIQFRIITKINANIKNILKDYEERYGYYITMTSELELKLKLKDGEVPKDKSSTEYRDLLRKFLEKNGYALEVNNFQTLTDELNTCKTRLFDIVREDKFQKLYFNALIKENAIAQDREIKKSLEKLLFELLGWHSYSRRYDLYILDNQSRTCVFQSTGLKDGFESDLDVAKENEIFILKGHEGSCRLNNPALNLLANQVKDAITTELVANLSGTSGVQDIPLELLMGEQAYVNATNRVIRAEALNTGLRKTIFEMLIRAFVPSSSRLNYSNRGIDEVKTGLNDLINLTAGEQKERRRNDLIDSLSKEIKNLKRTKKNNFQLNQYFCQNLKKLADDLKWLGFSDSIQNPNNLSYPHAPLFLELVSPVLIKIKEISISLDKSGGDNEADLDDTKAIIHELILKYEMAAEGYSHLTQDHETAILNATQEYKNILQNYLRENIYELGNKMGKHYDKGKTILYRSQIIPSFTLLLNKLHTEIIPLQGMNRISAEISSLLSLKLAPLFSQIAIIQNQQGIFETRTASILETIEFFIFGLGLDDNRLDLLNSLTVYLHEKILENDQNIIGELTARLIQALNNHPEKDLAVLKLSHQSYDHFHQSVMKSVRQYQAAPSFNQRFQRLFIGAANRQWLLDQASSLESITGVSANAFIEIRNKPINTGLILSLAVLSMAAEAKARSYITPGMAFFFLNLSRENRQIPRAPQVSNLRLLDAAALGKVDNLPSNSSRL